MKKIVVHMIGQAHLDPVWLWRWTEGRAEALGTSQSAVDRLAEYPDFHFIRGESQVYKWIEAENPPLFAEIQRLIQAGRWHVVNGMVIQPDMNLPQGESFVRQVMIGKRYIQDRFGVEPRVAYCVDSFGHAGTLPQILRKCGFTSYVFMRPGPHEKDLPANVFWWAGPDCSRILTFRIAGSYTTRVADHEAHIAQAVASKPHGLDATMCFFGVGNHGGGPTIEQIENVRALSAAHNDLDIRFSWPDAYFASIAADTHTLPTVVDELQYHAVGCFSVNSALKRAHRRAECALLVAERLVALAQQFVDSPAPRDRLRDLWHELCFNQFHDTLGGSSIKTASDDATAALGAIEGAAAAIIDSAGRAIGECVDTSGAGGTLLVFNSAAQEAQAYLEYEPWTDWQPWDEAQWGLVDEQDCPVPYQKLDPQSALGGHGIERLVFPVKVPPLGYCAYHFAPGLPRVETPVTNLRATKTLLENEYLRLRLDLDTGDIVSCIEKQTAMELVGPGAWNVAQVLEDISDTWSHGVQRYDRLIGTFGDAQITVGDIGPLQVSLLVERTYGDAQWLQQLVLRSGENHFLIRNWLTWQEPWRMIKLAFDVNTGSPQASHDIPFGWRHRPCDGAEVPTQMWMDVSGPLRGAAEHTAVHTVGAALINDGKYGCDVHGSTMRLTVLRCTPYAYHDPHQFGTKQRYDWVDRGSQEFTLVLCPHVGDWRDTGIVHQARALNLPLVPITMHCHSGDRPRHGSLLELSSAELELTTIKPAEDGDGYIVRLADAHGRGASGTLRWLQLEFPVTVAPFEVITLRIVPAELAQNATGWRIIATDMLERRD